MKIIVINGPNLNLLGVREPDVYGSETLADIENWLNEQPETDGHYITWFQSNHEGEIIDQLHSTIKEVDGIVINPGAFTHYSYAIRDALTAIDVPTVEVHLSNIYQREEFRKISVIKDVCVGQYFGKGKNSYLEAFRLLIR
ncbi:MAG: type II 3-dehydroquinate dehydratase [Candidatus Neomarinimicrobiota bacterium]|nr:type II 3-dehydroquinate dehydratase [Candidatus Neomarinimicrobiota bacterium]